MGEPERPVPFPRDGLEPSLEQHGGLHDSGLFYDCFAGPSSPPTQFTLPTGRIEVNGVERTELAAMARQHLQAARACLDRLEWHQPAAHADLALHLLEGEQERHSSARNST
jgi:hypothetical protein